MQKEETPSVVFGSWRRARAIVAAAQRVLPLRIVALSMNDNERALGGREEECLLLL